MRPSPAVAGRRYRKSRLKDCSVGVVGSLAEVLPVRSQEGDLVRVTINRSYRSREPSFLIDTDPANLGKSKIQKAPIGPCSVDNQVCTLLLHLDDDVIRVIITVQDVDIARRTL